MDRGRIVLHTFRDGLAATAGHDLTIEAGRWSGELTVSDDGKPAGLTVQVDMGSLIVREGTGGIKPLTDRDRREIAVTARKTLAADRYPEATFAAAEFEPAATVVQSAHGIKPYTGFFGALRVRDAVDVDVDVDLSGPDGATGAQPP